MIKQPGDSGTVKCMSGEIEARLYDALEAFAASRHKTLSGSPLDSLIIPLKFQESIACPIVLLAEARSANAVKPQPTNEPREERQYKS